MGEQFKVGDRVRRVGAPNSTFCVVDADVDTGYVSARDDRYPGGAVYGFVRSELVHVDPDPIAAYRRPATGINPVLAEDRMREQIQAQAAQQRGCYAPGLKVSQPLDADPIAAAKAKCDETSERALALFGRPPKLVELADYNCARNKLADECQTLRDENQRLHAQANRDRMRIEQLELHALRERRGRK